MNTIQLSRDELIKSIEHKTQSINMLLARCAELQHENRRLNAHIDRIKKVALG